MGGRQDKMIILHHDDHLMIMIIILHLLHGGKGGLVLVRDRNKMKHYIATDCMNMNFKNEGQMQNPYPDQKLNYDSQQLICVILIDSTH